MRPEVYTGKDAGPTDFLSLWVSFMFPAAVHVMYASYSKLPNCRNSVIKAC